MEQPIVAQIKDVNCATVLKYIALIIYCMRYHKVRGDRCQVPVGAL